MSFMLCPVVSLCCTLRELQIYLSLLHKEKPSCLLDTELVKNHLLYLSRSLSSCEMSLCSWYFAVYS